MGIGAADLFLYRTFAVVICLLSMYTVTIGILLVKPSSLDSGVSEVLLRAEGVFVDSFASLWSTSFASLYLYVVASNEHHLLRMLQALNSAVYPREGQLCVELVVVTMNPLINAANFARRSHYYWRHGSIRVESAARVVNQSSFVILLEDTAEVSPFYALWFLLHLNSSAVVIGGGNASSPVGVGVRSELWNDLVFNFSEVDALLRGVRDYPIIHPRLADGRVFVRKEVQSLVMPERDPKLVRAWNYDPAQWFV